MAYSEVSKVCLKHVSRKWHHFVGNIRDGDINQHQHELHWADNLTKPLCKSNERTLANPSWVGTCLSYSFSTSFPPTREVLGQYFGEMKQNSESRQECHTTEICSIENQKFLPQSQATRESWKTDNTGLPSRFSTFLTESYTDSCQGIKMIITTIFIPYILRYWIYSLHEIQFIMSKCDPLVSLILNNGRPPKS